MTIVSNNFYYIYYFFNLLYKVENLLKACSNVAKTLQEQKLDVEEYLLEEYLQT